MDYKDYVRSYPDFPKKDVLFWDFTYLLKDVNARKNAIEEIKEFLKDKKIDKIAAIESKGFTIGSILAYELNLPLVLIRKPNLIPGEYYSEEFVKEYGTAEYQIKKDAIEENENVVIVYDIMAGSGASMAGINLVKKCGGNVSGLVYITELEYLNGREDLKEYDIFSLVKVKEKGEKY
jgi:adenine phosphoribosyltransferase